MSNYAVLLITNRSITPMNFTSFNTSPEGTVKHVYSLHSSTGWGAPQDFKPQQPGSLFYFAETLEPHQSRSVRVPVDEVERTVAIPFYVVAQNATPAQNRFLRLRSIIRHLLGLPNDVVGNVFWCPVPLHVELSGPPQRSYLSVGKLSAHPSEARQGLLSRDRLIYLGNLTTGAKAP